MQVLSFIKPKHVKIKGGTVKIIEPQHAKLCNTYKNTKPNLFIIKT